MEENNTARAEVLIHALPYIKEFRGKTMVVKYGGNAMINAELKKNVIEDLILMSFVGIRVVLVHGGGPEIEQALNAAGKESRFVEGLRYTDEETMEIVQMVLCGKVNKEITALIENSGGSALGISGIDGSLLQARQYKPGGKEIGLVGEIITVDTAIVEKCMNGGAIPVVASVALGTGSDAGKVFNINADTAAAKIASALKAEKLILMTDVAGILQNIHDEASLVKVIESSEIGRLKNDGTVSKGMIPKADCCVLALEEGVKKTHIIDGRLPHALLIELFTDEGIGTMIVKEKT